MNSYLKSYSSDNISRFRYIAAASGLLLICSVALNVLLSQKLREINHTINAIKDEGRLKVGSDAEPIEAKTLAGTHASIIHTGINQPTILYVFSPQCGWCARNMQNFKRVTAETKDKYKVIGLSLSEDGLRDYIDKYKLDFPILTNPSVQTVTAYKLGGTPQTVVISAEGKVLKNWSGVFDGNNASEIEEFFNIKLPGLSEE